MPADQKKHLATKLAAEKLNNSLPVIKNLANQIVDDALYGMNLHDPNTINQAFGEVVTQAESAYNEISPLGNQK